MKLKKILTILLLSAGMLGAVAQNPSTANAHHKAHEKLLANAKSGLDKSVIKDFLKQDIERRENLAAHHNPLSRETSAMLNDIIKEASSHKGKRYRSGAKGPNAFDCSGFSGYVFRQFGYNLGASSRDQYMQGEKVGRHELRTGDLVFFTGRNSKSNRVGHVGIVVTADNETGNFTFIHASVSQGIKIDSNTGYYSRRYVGARRIVNE